MLHLTPETVAKVKAEIQKARSGDSPMTVDNAYRAGQHVDLDTYRRFWREAEAEASKAVPAQVPSKPSK